ncbi:MAG TPA: hypothetical protein DEB74_16670 [Lachnospiraceae bacterium]|jgi:hypothetical protein|nr:hypothetical protein [Lachnospiraceae bacterium]
MNTDDQVFMLRKFYINEIDRIYGQKFQMRLISVMLFDQNKYSNSLKAIEVTSCIIERACVDCNPKRMLKYLVILKSVIDDLIEKTDKDYTKMWDNKLTH